MSENSNEMLLKDYNNKILSNISQNIKLLKVKNNLTYDSLAEKSGVSVDTIGRIVRMDKAPRFENLIRISFALGIELGELFTKP